MQRITQQMLKGSVERLNHLSNKRYVLISGYSQWRLCVSSNGVDTCDGIAEISCIGTTPEIYYIIQAIIQYHYTETNNGYENKRKSHAIITTSDGIHNQVHYSKEK